LVQHRFEQRRLDPHVLLEGAQQSLEPGAVELQLAPHVPPADHLEQGAALGAVQRESKRVFGSKRLFLLFREQLVVLPCSANAGSIA
jgi:hypothetical protein